MMSMALWETVEAHLVQAIMIAMLVDKIRGTQIRVKDREEILNNSDRTKIFKNLVTFSKEDVSKVKTNSENPNSGVNRISS